MKSLLLLICIASSFGALNAQISQATPQLPKQPYGFKGKAALNRPFAGNSIILAYPAELGNCPNTQTPNVDNMPVAGTGQVILTPTGNNRAGFDIYKASPDNMTVLKPDSTFYTNMPNSFNPAIKPIEKR